MTNEMAFSNLTAEGQQEFRKVYNRHPLSDYIDWQAYFASENGNALDFVKCIDKFKDADGNQIYVLEEVVEDDLDYKLVFNCGDNIFGKIPA